MAVAVDFPRPSWEGEVRYEAWGLCAKCSGDVTIIQRTGFPHKFAGALEPLGHAFHLPLQLYLGQHLTWRSKLDLDVQRLVQLAQSCSGDIFFIRHLDGTVGEVLQSACRHGAALVSRPMWLGGQRSECVECVLVGLPLQLLCGGKDGGEGLLGHFGWAAEELLVPELADTCVVALLAPNSSWLFEKRKKKSSRDWSGDAISLGLAPIESPLIHLESLLFGQYTPEDDMVEEHAQDGDSTQCTVDGGESGCVDVGMAEHHVEDGMREHHVEDGMRAHHVEDGMREHHVEDGMREQGAGSGGGEQDEGFGSLSQRSGDGVREQDGEAGIGDRTAEEGATAQTPEDGMGVECPMWEEEGEEDCYDQEEAYAPFEGVRLRYSVSPEGGSYVQQHPTLPSTDFRSMAEHYFSSIAPTVARLDPEEPGDNLADIPGSIGFVRQDDAAMVVNSGAA